MNKICSSCWILDGILDTMVFLVCMVIMINFRSLIVLMAFGALHPLLRYDRNDEIERNALHKKSERHKRPWVPKTYFYF